MRPLVYGNGNLLVCVDEKGVVRELYYPDIGLNNHLCHIKVGVYDIYKAKFEWIHDWEIEQHYTRYFPRLIDLKSGKTKFTIYEQKYSMIGENIFRNEKFGIEVTLRENVHPNMNIFLRFIIVKNIGNEEKKLRLFSCHKYNILGNSLGETAICEEKKHMLTHFKQNRYFLHASECKFDAFSVKNIDEEEGVCKDVVDGKLECKRIANGNVESGIGWNLEKVKVNESATIFWWLCAGRNFREVKKINSWAWSISIEDICTLPRNYWHSWIQKVRTIPKITALQKGFKDALMRSLLTIACHMNMNGAILSSSDSPHGYCQCIPSEMVWSIMALDAAGYTSLSLNALNFLREIVSDKGYLLARYTSKGEVGILEHFPFPDINATALLIFALYHHWLVTREVATVSKFYDSIIEPGANFIVNKLDERTHLPVGCYDIWNEVKDTSTFTASAVFGSLKGASELAQTIGSRKETENWNIAAKKVKEGIIKFLYSKDLKRFKKSLRDSGIDASLFSVWYYGVLPPADPRVIATMRSIEKELKRKNGGIARHSRDKNAWIVPTLWLAQWYSATNQFDEAAELIKWCIKNACSTGLLPQQVGENGELISPLPFVWSHSTLVLTILEFLKKF